MDQELYMTEQALQRREHQRREELRGREDLRTLLNQPQGRRFLLELLQRLGVGRPLGEGDLPLFNFGMGLVARIGKVNRQAQAQLVAELFAPAEEER